jgi:hypothetical protein
MLRVQVGVKDTASMANNEKEGKRKFSFLEKMTVPTLFHKKTEASFQTAITLPSKNNRNPNKSM